MLDWFGRYFDMFSLNMDLEMVVWRWELRCIPICCNLAWFYGSFSCGVFSCAIRLSSLELESCCGSPRFTEVQWNLLACILHCCRGSTSSNEKAKTTRTSVPYFWVTVWDFCDVYQWQFPGVKNCRNPPSRTTSCSGAGLWYCFAINRCIGKRCQSHQYWHLLAFAAFGRAICPEVHSVNAEWVLHHDFWHHGR